MRFGYGIVGLLLLVLTIVALVRLVQSRVDPTTKIVWILVILLLPPIGAILYFLIGPRA
jgi:hypothetical protein